MIATTLLAASLAIPLDLPTPPTPWFGEDKLKHFVTSFVATSIAASGARLAGFEPRTSVYIGSGFAAATGLYKEIQDVRTTGFSAADLVWDAGGIAASALIVDAAR